MARAVAAIALLAGCVVHVDYSRTMFRCDDGVCPSGFQCADKVCRPDGADLSVAVDGGDDLASIPDLGNCGATSSVVDNFDPNVVASVWNAIRASARRGQPR